MNKKVNTKTLLERGGYKETLHCKLGEVDGKLKKVNEEKKKNEEQNKE